VKTEKKTSNGRTCGLTDISVPLFVGILVLWVFEVQLLMQIIINRIAVVVEDQRLLRRLKVGFLLSLYAS
jgi:hypothetical protein